LFKRKKQATQKVAALPLATQTFPFLTNTKQDIHMVTMHV